MHVIHDLALLCLGILIKEFLVKPVLLAYFRKALRLLPELLENLYPVMPKYLVKLSSPELKGKVYSAIDALAQEKDIILSEKEKKLLYDEFIIKFNPVLAADKVTV